MITSPTLTLMVLLVVAFGLYAMARVRLTRRYDKIEAVRQANHLQYAPVDRLGLAQLLADQGELRFPGAAIAVEARRVAVTDVLYARQGELRFFVARVCESGRPCSGAVVSGFEKCGKTNSSSAAARLSGVEWSTPGEDELSAFGRLASRFSNHPALP